MRRTYRINGTVWEQKPLLFEANERANELLKKHFPLSRINEMPIGEIIEKFAKSEVMAPMITLLLQPYSGKNVLLRAFNGRLIRLKGMNSSNVYKWLDEVTTYRVVTDFFVFKARPLMLLFGQSTSYKSRLLNRLTRLNPFRSTNFSTPSPVETSPSAN